MATKEEIIEGIQLFHDNRPQHAFDEMRKSDNGTYAVLKFLSEQQGEVKSKDISTALHISTARMAVLLKKMEGKGLICKSSSTVDARATIVSLSEYGLKRVKEFNEGIQNSVSILIDQYGLEKIKDVFTHLNEFKDIMHTNMLDIMEERNE